MTREEFLALPSEEQQRIYAERQAAPPAPVAVPGAPEGEAPPDYDTGGFNAFASGLGQGLTFGLSDELRARLLAAGPTNYRDELARIRAEGQALQTAHPNLRNAGQVVGAVAPLLVPGVGAAATGARLAGTGARVAAGAGTGAAMGGLSGWGHGTATDLGGQLTDAGVGAAVGGVTGAGTTAVFNKIAQAMGWQTSRALEREIAQIAKTSGRSTDEIVAAVGAGDDLASQGIEVSATLRAAINRMRTAAGKETMPAAPAAAAPTAASTALGAAGKVMKGAGAGAGVDAALTFAGVPPGVGTTVGAVVGGGKALIDVLRRSGLPAAEAAQAARILTSTDPAFVEAALAGKIPGREISNRAMMVIGGLGMAPASAAGAQAPGMLDMLEGGF